MSSSFGRWYEEKKNEENGDSSASSSWFPDTESLLPMFSTENLQPVSWSSMKQSMESQMPKKILGMGYQQRFKVSVSLFVAFLLICNEGSDRSAGLDAQPLPH